MNLFKALIRRFKAWQYRREYPTPIPQQPSLIAPPVISEMIIGYIQEKMQSSENGAIRLAMMVNLGFSSYLWTFNDARTEVTDEWGNVITREGFHPNGAWLEIVSGDGQRYAFVPPHATVREAEICQEAVEYDFGTVFGMAARMGFRQGAGVAV